MSGNNVSDSPVVSLRVGLLSLSAILIAALVIMLIRHGTNQQPADAELVELSSLQDYAPMQVSAGDTVPARAVRKAHGSVKRTKKSVRKPRKEASRPEQYRQITDETLNSE